jgi:hypothetical protein
MEHKGFTFIIKKVYMVILKKGHTFHNYKILLFYIEKVIMDFLLI